MEVISASGHPNILATHKTTIEWTREAFLNTTGDCIIGIKADKGLKDIDEGLKEHLKLAKKIRITLECGGLKDFILARGDPRLTFESPTTMIVRKSDYVCDRTLAVKADKAAADLDRKLVEELKKGGTLKITLEAV